MKLAERNNEPKAVTHYFRHFFSYLMAYLIGVYAAVMPSYVSGQELTDQRWAIIIGINEYQDSGVGDLEYAVADAEGFSQTLTEIPGGVPVNNIMILTDKATDPKRLPTRSNIITQLSVWLNLVGPNDTVLIYFAGHGIDRGDKTFLLPRDATMANLQLSSLELDYVKEELRECRAKRKVLIIDACHSGAGRGIQVMERSMSRTLSDAPSGMIIMASCGLQERSHEMPNKGHGAFTYFLTEALRGAADTDANGLLLASEVSIYVFESTRRWAASQSLKQTPIFSFGSNSDFVLGRTDGLEQQAVNPITESLPNESDTEDSSLSNIVSLPPDEDSSPPPPSTPEQISIRPTANRFPLEGTVYGGDYRLWLGADVLTPIVAESFTVARNKTATPDITPFFGGSLHFDAIYTDYYGVSFFVGINRSTAGVFNLGGTSFEKNPTSIYKITSLPMGMKLFYFSPLKENITGLIEIGGGMFAMNRTTNWLGYADKLNQKFVIPFASFGGGIRIHPPGNVGFNLNIAYIVPLIRKRDVSANISTLPSSPSINGQGLRFKNAIRISAGFAVILKGI